MPVFSAIAASLAALGTAGAAGGAAAGATAATSLAGAVGAVGTVAGLAGTALQYTGQQKAASAQQEAERLRQAQMNSEAIRQRRQALRASIVARGQAVSNASGQGAQDGSGLSGGLAQIQNTAGSNLQATNNGTQLGTGIFQANSQAAQGQTTSALGSGVSSLGGALVKNQEAIGRVGANIFARI